LTLLVNSKTPRKAILHPTLKGQRDRGCCVEQCTPMLLEIQQLRLNQQSQNIVYLSAELNRLCRIRVSTDISIHGLSPVGGLILPLYSVVAHRNATPRVQSI